MQETGLSRLRIIRPAFSFFFFLFIYFFLQEIQSSATLLKRKTSSREGSQNGITQEEVTSGDTRYISEQRCGKGLIIRS